MHPELKSLLMDTFIITLGLLALAYVYIVITERSYWKGFKDGKRLEQNTRSRQITK